MQATSPTSRELVDRQNPDGGWGYRRGGSSWTEPTCYALLALQSDTPGAPDTLRRGVEWLAARHRAGGGWSPRESVKESTWVTALVLLLPAAVMRALEGKGVDRQRAEAWVLEQTGRESGWVERLRMRLLGVPADPSQAFDGWPWYPGAAAWVTPTALTILALEKLERQRGGQNGAADIRERIAQGRSFLLARRCRDGGWNHGSTRALGYDSDSYPETTGMALLALHDVSAVPMDDALRVAEKHLKNCQSQEAASWLTLGLLARGRNPAPSALAGHGGTTEIALQALAGAARAGRNVFIE
jgi:hypothetical protein